MPSTSPASPPAGSEASRGARLGRPVQGPGAVAGFGRRLLALAIDWGASTLVTLGTFPTLEYGSQAFSARLLGVFAVEVAVLTWLAGGSFGQLATRLRVERVPGGRLGLGAAVVRTLLLCLVIPALVYDRDGRGLHDRAAGSVVVHR